MSKNRINDIVKITDSGKRNDVCWKFYNALSSGKEKELSLEETLQLLKLIPDENSIHYKSWYWYFLYFSKPNQEIKKLALNSLDLEDNYIKGMAFSYLSKLFPDLIPDLVKKYKDDPCPDIRHIIASIISESDAKKGMEMMIEVLPHAFKSYNHELAHFIVTDIMKKGTSHHLQLLRKHHKNNFMDLGKYFGKIADGLEKKLTHNKK